MSKLDHTMIKIKRIYFCGIETIQKDFHAHPSATPNFECFFGKYPCSAGSFQPGGFNIFLDKCPKGIVHKREFSFVQEHTTLA